MQAPEALARLNPTTIRYDTGRGGIPNLTPQDIAAAIAFVPKGLGRELMCRMWWPAGAKLTVKDLELCLMDAQFAEWARLADALIVAQIREARAEGRMLAREAENVREARDAMWPGIGGITLYGAVRKAVMVEMSAAGLCGECQGRGSIIVNSKLQSCEACRSTGRKKVSDRARSEMIGADWANYRRRWAKVYEWTIHHCEDAIGPAERKLRSALA